MTQPTTTPLDDPQVVLGIIRRVGATYAGHPISDTGQQLRAALREAADLVRPLMPRQPGDGYTTVLDDLKCRDNLVSAACHDLGDYEGGRTAMHVLRLAADAVAPYVQQLVRQRDEALVALEAAKALRQLAVDERDAARRETGQAVLDRVAAEKALDLLRSEYDAHTALRADHDADARGAFEALLAERNAAVARAEAAEAELAACRPSGVWSLPDEPGPEVLAVRDRDGDLWRRRLVDGAPVGWVWAVPDEAARLTNQWSNVFDNYPLTDATAEVTP